MKDENFCPICGKTNARFVKGLCIDCFQKKHSLVEFPEKVSFEQCTGCGKIKLQGKFVPLQKEALASIAEKSVKVKGLEKPCVQAEVEERPEGFFAKILVKGIVERNPVAFQATIAMEPAFVQCDACMRLSSQYHEAIVQLRSQSPKLAEKALESFVGSIKSQAKKDTLAAVTEIAKAKNGFDLKVGSKKAAQNAAKALEKKFGAKTKVSKKALKRNRTRFTFSVRL
jgi:NMD protein affecting ribosome stability and mRNA decay